MEDSQVYLGNDIVYLPNFKNSLTEEFIHKVYSQNEIDYCVQFKEPLQHYASTWAAKEAIYKMLKQINPSIIISWKNIEILRAKIGGIPTLNLKHDTMIFSEPVSLTLTHDGDYVWACAGCIRVKDI